MKPICFKVRGGGNYSGTKGGAVRPNEKGGAGYLGYEDKTFTIATSPDQWICTMKPIISPTITTCKGSRGGCSDEAIQELVAVHLASQSPLPQPNPMNEPAQPEPVGRPIRYLSVCSGMEAASVAWHPLGWTPVGFSEIEPFPCAILKHRFPNTPNYGSLTEYQSWPLQPGSIDLLVGGTPCQSFSVAGLRKGLADPRGNLALTFLGLADKLKPRWIVWENVPGVLSSGGGRDFGSFLGALVELGYGFAYRVLDAQYVGRPRAVPQRRRRVFVVACRNPLTGLGDWRAAAEVLSLGEGLRGYLETGNKKRKTTSADAGAGVEASGLQRTVGTLCADTHPGAYSGQDAYTGRLIPSHWEGGDVHPTLNQSAKGSGGVGSSNQELFSQGGAYLVPGQPIPIQDGRKMEKHQNGLGNQYVQKGKCIPCPAPAHITQAEVAGPLDAHYYKGPGSRQGGEREYVAVPFRKSKRACSTTDNETWVPADASNTTSSPLHFDTYNQTTSDISFTLSCSASDANHTGTVFVPNMAVRRLTPNECMRLQGFPDNWARIPWKGKPAEQCPDGPQYKAAGNSMAVPVMAWIGNRIAEVEAKGHQS
jgi:DNA (cytosine-5)-methyltransferase 1